jgi:hypothetical protein
MNPRRTRQRIGIRHPPNQRSEFRRHTRTSQTSRFPGPEETKALSMPGDNRRGLHAPASCAIRTRCARARPIGRDRHASTEGVAGVSLGARVVDGAGEDFRLQGGSCLERCTGGTKKRDDEGRHREAAYLCIAVTSIVTTRTDFSVGTGSWRAHPHNRVQKSRQIDGHENFSSTQARSAGETARGSVRRISVIAPTRPSDSSSGTNTACSPNQNR